MAQKIVYNHKAVEKKWREKWQENPVNPKTDENGNKKEIIVWTCSPIRQETDFM